MGIRQLELRTLLGRIILFGLGEVGKKYDITIEKWGEMATKSFERYFNKIPGLISKMVKNISTRTKLVEMFLHKRDKKNRKNAIRYPVSFETKTQIPTEDYPINFYTTFCQLYNFAKENNYLEYMPYLCNLDYAMFNAFFIPLYREKTLADVDEYCDFKIKKGGKIESAYPPNILRKNDPLK